VFLQKIFCLLADWKLLKTKFLSFGYLCCVGWMFMPVASMASDSLPGMSFAALLKVGNKYFKRGYYYDALRYYEEAVKRDSLRLELLFQLGMAHHKMRNHSEALKWFLKATHTDVGCSTPALYYTALSQKHLGNCKEAVLHFNAFAACYKGKENQLKEWVSTDVFGCLERRAIDDTFKIIQLPAYINSGYSELSPAIWKGDLYFASIRSDTVVFIRPDSAASQPVMQFFVAKYVADTFRLPKVFEDLRLSAHHLTSLSFNEKNRELYFSLCYGELQDANCAIWRAIYEDGNWTGERELNEKVNFNLYANTHPCLARTAEGKEILWFSSNRPGGFGGYDIWFAERQKDGKFSAAKNAGKIINTSRDEVSPFFDESSSTLFFSSSGLPSLGGLDVFYARFANGKFAAPKPLPPPLNTSYDESFFRFFENGRGFFVSNRPGVFSVKGTTCCDDIFQFEVSKSIRPWLKLAAIDSNGNVVDGALMMVKNEADSVLWVHRGKTAFIQLPQNGNYIVSFSAEGFFNTEKNLSIQAFSSQDTAEAAVMLQAVERNKAYRINNIYFDFNSFELNETAREALQEIVLLLKKNPALKIEIASHTDARGEDGYNLFLSQKRAESVVNFLIENGTDAQRLQAKGYGESVPLRDCTLLKECKEQDCECHQLNRRTEFKIVE
jgi:outer membrane protein OmpA-like peptidoglycan-associated protein